MSPLEINVLLWCYFRPTGFDEPSPAATQAHHDFIIAGLIEPVLGTDYFTCTEAGKKLVEMLCNTPFPINVWIDPRTKS